MRARVVWVRREAHLRRRRWHFNATVSTRAMLQGSGTVTSGRPKLESASTNDDAPATPDCQLDASNPRSLMSMLPLKSKSPLIHEPLVCQFEARIPRSLISTSPSRSASPDVGMPTSKFPRSGADPTNGLPTSTPALISALPFTNLRKPLMGKLPLGLRGPVAIASSNEMKLLVPTEKPLFQVL